MVEIAEGQIVEGKYRVDRVIGRGGMGIVVAARHLALDETVAIKFLTEQALASEEAVARFEREARAAVKIKNEHVVRVFDVGRLASGPPYMVMEFLEGEDLSARIAQGPLPVALAVDYVLQACVALAAAHAAGIVHRDIKPANLFCQQGDDGQVLIKVLDFGISKLVDAVLGDSGMSVTKTSSVMGSPLYMSPEQVHNSKDVDGRTDIWALGVVLFEAISGGVPFKGETFGQVVIQIATQPAPRLVQFRRDVPPALDAVIARCLEKDRGQRIASVAELAQALRPFATRRGQAAAERIANVIASSSSLRGPRSAPLPPLAESKLLAAALPETAPAWTKTEARRDNRLAIVGTVVVAALGLIALTFVLLRPHASPTPEPSGAPSSSELAPPQTAAPSEPSVLIAPAGPVSPPPSLEPPAVKSTPSLAETAAPAPEPEPLPARGMGQIRRPSRPAAAAATIGRDIKPPRTESTGAVAPAPAPAAKAPATAAKAPAPAATNPDCDPPYTFDEQGRKKFKRECFLK